MIRVIIRSRPHVSGYFGKRIFFYSFWDSVHTSTAFLLTENEAFRKRFPEWIVLKMPFFMLLCGRVKTELFENADVTASIHYVSEHAHGSLGITRGHLACLFSIMEVRTSKFECSSVFVWTGIFSKTLLVWTRIFFIRIKRDAFSKISVYVWTGP